MAVPTDAAIMAGMVNFCVDSLRNEDGSHRRPVEVITQRTRDEGAQITRPFALELHALIITGKELEDRRNEADETRIHEWVLTGQFWDSLTPEMRQIQTQKNLSNIDRYRQACRDLRDHHTLMIDRCRTHIAQNYMRVRSEYAQVHELGQFVECVHRRRQWENTRIAEVVPDKTMCLAPTQVARAGNKIKAKYDIPNGMMKVWFRQVLPPASAVTQRAWANEQQALAKLPQEPGGTWHGDHLGAGGMGSAVLFTKRSANGTVVQRIVMKDSYEDDNPNSFRSASHWHGDVMADDWQTQCVPLEYHTQKLVSEGSKRNVVRVVGRPHVDFIYGRFRIMMEYSPEGDLETAIKVHQKEKEPIPEGFIWLCMQGFANASLAMKQGSETAALSPWSEIVHLDWKPENIFLGAASETEFTHWPTPQVGDFGLAVVTSSDDPTNPWCQVGGGTSGYFASEQIQYIDSETGQPVDARKILSPCNVYGMGMVLYALMEQRYSMLQPTFLPGVNPREHEFNDLVVALYSNELRNWVKACLHSDPSQRPTVEELKQFTDLVLARPQWASDRAGVAGPVDDTFLWPKHAVQLKWASRMNDGPQGVDATRREREETDPDDPE